MQTITARELSPGDRVYLASRAWGAATILTTAHKNNSTQVHITCRRDGTNAHGSHCLAPELAIEVAPEVNR